MTEKRELERRQREEKRIQKEIERVAYVARMPNVLEVGAVISRPIYVSSSGEEYAFNEHDASTTWDRLHFTISCTLTDSGSNVMYAVCDASNGRALLDDYYFIHDLKKVKVIKTVDNTFVTFDMDSEFITIREIFDTAIVVRSCRTLVREYTPSDTDADTATPDYTYHCEAIQINM